MTATIANGPGNAGDWVGLFAAGASAPTYLECKYLNGTRTRPASGLTGAALTFRCRRRRALQLRFFRNNTYTVLATSATITVTSPAPPSITLSATTVCAGATVMATIANGPGNAGDWVGLYAALAPRRCLPRLEVSERDADGAGQRLTGAPADVHAAGDAGHPRTAVLPE